MASFVCDCFQSGTVERLLFNAVRVKVRASALQVLTCSILQFPVFCTVVQDTAEGVGEELLTRLESAVRDNNTMRELNLQFNDSSLPNVPANVAEAILKGAVHNKGLERMDIPVPVTGELHKLVDEVKQVNRELRLDIRHHNVSLCTIFVCLYSLQLFVEKIPY